MVCFSIRPVLWGCFQFISLILSYSPLIYARSAVDAHSLLPIALAMDETVLVTLARVAERAERYDEMADFMKQRVQVGSALNPEELPRL